MTGDEVDILFNVFSALLVKHLYLVVANNRVKMTSMSVPKQQKAAIKEGEGHDAKAPVKQIDVATPGPSEILVKIHW